MINKLFIILCAVFITGNYNAQQRSKYEWKWAVLHPFAALKLNKIKKKCDAIYNGGGVLAANDNFPNGGKQDAYRHIFYFAAFAQKVKSNKVKKLGEAHEKANYKQFLEAQTEQGEIPDSLSTVMDLHNNELGMKLGKNNPKVDLYFLSAMALEEVKNGEALIMKRNRAGKYIDCTGKEIDMQLFQKKWNIPKCLTLSRNVR